IFAGEGVDASPSQQEAWVSALVAPLMEDEKLLGQAGANSLEQFLASPNLERSAMGAVYANEDAFVKMTDIVGRGGDPSKMIVAAIGEYLYWKVRSEGAGPVDYAEGVGEAQYEGVGVELETLAKNHGSMFGQSQTY
ncbi:hypothetical protein ACWDYA_14550, partial [Micrococcus luteus]